MSENNNLPKGWGTRNNSSDAWGGKPSEQSRQAVSPWEGKQQKKQIYTEKNNSISAKHEELNADTGNESEAVFEENNNMSSEYDNNDMSYSDDSNENVHPDTNDEPNDSYEPTEKYNSYYSSSSEQKMKSPTAQISNPQQYANNNMNSSLSNQRMRNGWQNNTDFNRSNAGNSAYYDSDADCERNTVLQSSDVPQYVIQSEKSSAFPVIIGISFGLIAAAALFFGIKYFDSQKESVDNPPAEIVADTTSIVTESVTEIVTTVTEAQTEAVTEAQTEAVTEAVTATTEKYATEKQKIRDSVDNEVYSGRNSHIENLPDDMTLYDLHGALSTIEVKNVTLLEGAADNCRAAVSITGKEKMEILGENADWYYLVHYVGTGKCTHPEYGFIRKTTAKNSGTDPNEYTDKSNLIAVGYVNTQETTLNMRETPSTSAAITTQIPKGDYVGILYNQDGWMYVKYYKNTSSPIYYGYVSSSYITVTESYQKSGSSAVSCNKYGTIDAHSGVVSGYSSSYVLYGGAVATVRQSLGDGWHIQAVRVYSSGGITWYELYDYQDNDYYGWVDSAFIDFY